MHDDLGFVDGLLAQVIGKTEKAKKLPPGTISSWSFKAHPWLCPTRHLLILIRIVGHVSVYFLMNHENLVEVGADPDQDNSVTEQTSHTNFLVGLRCFTSLFVKRDAHIGLRTLRNTVCLFGMLGGENRDDLRKTSRRASANSCN